MRTVPSYLSLFAYQSVRTAPRIRALETQPGAKFFWVSLSLASTRTVIAQFPGAYFLMKLQYRCLDSGARAAVEVAAPVVR